MQKLSVYHNFVSLNLKWITHFSNQTNLNHSQILLCPKLLFILTFVGTHIFATYMDIT
jgi:hypothetical protein